MHKENASENDSTHVDLEAAEWLVRSDRGLSPAEQDQFLQWLAADPRRREWLARHKQTWRNLDLLVQWRPEHADEPNPDLLARPHPSRRKLWVLASLAAAASLVAALRWVRPLVVSSEKNGNAAGMVVAQQYENRVLEDGTVVELSSGTMLKVDYEPSVRHVQLVKGEAHFHVAPNHARPFIVQAGSVAVRAVGTVFDVRLGAHTVAVLVTEGKVSVDVPEAGVAASADRQVYVSAGERTVVQLDSGSPIPPARAVTDAEITRLLAWQPIMLNFESTPLSDVVAAFNQRNKVQLVITDPRLARLPIVATIRSDNLNGFLRLLTATAGVHVERRADTVLLSK